jgi:hypothetical protein
MAGSDADFLSLPWNPSFQPGCHRGHGLQASEKDLLIGFWGLENGRLCSFKAACGKE